MFVVLNLTSQPLQKTWLFDKTVLTFSLSKLADLFPPFLSLRFERSTFSTHRHCISAFLVCFLKLGMCDGTTVRIKHSKATTELNYLYINTIIINDESFVNVLIGLTFKKR